MTERSAPKNIDEYIASFPAGVQSILREDQINDQESCTSGRGTDQLQDASFYPERRSDLLCRLQEAHRPLSAGAEVTRD